MAKQIIDDTVMENIEILAKLALTCEEREKAREKMQEMLDYIDKLNELTTEETEPLAHTFPVENVFREDVVTNGNSRDAMLANAPKSKDGQYQVPKTVQ